MRLPELTFLYGESVPACTHHIDKHFKGYQTLQYMAGGGVDLWIGDKRYLLSGRWFWSAYPGPRIRFCAGNGCRTWRHRYIAFRGPRVEQWVQEGLFPVVPQPAPNGVDYGARFDDLLALSQRTGRLGILRAIHALEGLLLELAQSRIEPASPPAWLDLTMARLAAAAEGQFVAYDQLAAELGMSSCTLRRRFKRATGLCPHAYLLQNRIGLARRLLAQTDLPIKTIARQLGYRDIYFFSRQFRKLAGVPPAIYRRSRHG